MSLGHFSQNSCKFKDLRDFCTEFYANPFSKHVGTVLGDP